MGDMTVTQREVGAMYRVGDGPWWRPLGEATVTVTDAPIWTVFVPWVGEEVPWVFHSRVSFPQFWEQRVGEEEV